MMTRHSLPLTIRPTLSFYTVMTVSTFLLFNVPGLAILLNLGAKRPVNESPETHIYAGAFICAAGFIASILLYILYRKLPTTVINENGVLSPSYSSELVPWTEITSIETDYVRFIKYIKLGVKGSFAMMAPAPSRLSQSLRTGYLWLPALGCGIALNDVKRLCEDLAARSKLKRP